jgi:hypothetical protein
MCPSDQAVSTMRTDFMKHRRDKDVVEYWLRLYNRLTGTSFKVEDRPDNDSSKKNIDAMCRDNYGHTLAIEHTLIEPFAGEKDDAARFLRTLASLENHPSLLQRGYVFSVSQPVGSVPTGINWAGIPKELLRQLPSILPTLPEGDSAVTIRTEWWVLNLHIKKLKMGPDYLGKFLTGRIYPGDPGPELIIRALYEKVPKLSASKADKKILLLEKDAVAGTIESQFEQIPDEHEIRKLLIGIDEVWAANTAGLESESVIFTNQIVPQLDYTTICSLNIHTDDFWRVSH